MYMNIKLTYFTRKLNNASTLLRCSTNLKKTFQISFRSLSGQTPVLAVHKITIKSCGALYERWMKIGRFDKLPNSDLTFQVNYIDTFKGSTVDSQAPVVVALHGAPGSCSEFSNLAEFLFEKGVRVVSPSFPDFSSYRPGIFKHTDEEKAQYVTDFLSSISVPKIDLLVCHSSAIYPGLLLCLNQNPAVKSIAMLNAATFSLKMPAIRNYSALKLMVMASENPILLKVMEAIGPTALKLAKIPVRADNFLDPLLSATAMIHGNILESKDKFHQLTSAGFPIFYAFSENDKLIGENNASELASFLGAKSSDICFINEHGVIEREGHETPKLKVMSFENGSHYVFFKYSNIINSALYAFLKQQISSGDQS